MISGKYSNISLKKVFKPERRYPSKGRDEYSKSIQKYSKCLRHEISQER